MKTPVNNFSKSKENNVLSAVKKNWVKMAFVGAVSILGINDQVNGQVISPDQQGHYTVSFREVRDYGKTKPGLNFFTYGHYGWANNTKTGFGKAERKELIEKYGAADSNAVLSTSVSNYTIVPALFFNTDLEILGAKYSAGIMPSFYQASSQTNLSNKGSISEFVIEESRSNQEAGIIDIDVIPLGLIWSKEHYDFSLYYGFSAPVQKITSDNIIGEDFFSHRVQGFGYLYPNVNRRTALMMGMTYEMNQGIRGKEYNPGERLAFEWGVNHFFNYRFEGSLMGGHNFQVSDHQSSIMDLDAPERTHYNTIGAGLSFWAIKQQLKVGGKYMYDYGVNQREMNQSIMVNVAFFTNPNEDDYAVKKQNKKYLKAQKQEAKILAEMEQELLEDIEAEIIYLEQQLLSEKMEYEIIK